MIGSGGTRYAGQCNICNKHIMGWYLVELSTGEKIGLCRKHYLEYMEKGIEYEGKPIEAVNVEDFYSM